MAWYNWILVGYSICATLVILILIKKVGIKYEINGQIKQKGRKTTNTVSDIKTTVETSKKENKQRNKRKLFTKKEKS